MPKPWTLRDLERLNYTTKSALMKRLSGHAKDCRQFHPADPLAEYTTRMITMRANNPHIDGELFEDCANEAWESTLDYVRYVPLELLGRPRANKINTTIGITQGSTIGITQGLSQGSTIGQTKGENNNLLPIERSIAIPIEKPIVVSRSSVRIYSMLLHLADEKVGIHPHRISCSSRNLARLLGYVTDEGVLDYSRAAEEVRIATAEGIIGVVRAGRLGNAAVYALRMQGETIEQAIADGKQQLGHAQREDIRTKDVALDRPSEVVPPERLPIVKPILRHRDEAPTAAWIQQVDIELAHDPADPFDNLLPMPGHGKSDIEAFLASIANEVVLLDNTGRVSNQKKVDELAVLWPRDKRGELVHLREFARADILCPEEHKFYLKASAVFGQAIYLQKSQKWRARQAVA